MLDRGRVMISDAAFLGYQKGTLILNIVQASLPLKHDEEATYAHGQHSSGNTQKMRVNKAKDLYVHFVNLCKEENYKLTGGAQTDLRDLIKKNIMAIQASGILGRCF